MVVYDKPRPLVKRVASVNDVTQKIQRFDSDNLYPERAEELVQRSPTLYALMNRIADFINGEGFADPNIASLVVNKSGIKGQTLNKVLEEVSHPKARFKTIALHIGYNLNGAISSITPIPFKSVRFGVKNKEGVMKYYAYSPDWTKGGRVSNESKLKFYRVFNPDPATVLQEMNEDGGIYNYCGQILYDTPVPGQYPLATFDPVFDDAQVQQDISLFKVGNTQNSFLSTLAILYPGEFASTEEEANFRELIANKSGTRNAGTRIGLQDKSGQRKASDIFQSLTPVNLDKLFEYTEKSVKENIIELEAFPQILMGKSPSGLFAQGDMEEAYIYANSITRNRRNSTSELFSLLLSYWETPIITDAAIIEQRYIRNSAAGSAVDVNDNLKGMTGAESINFARILRKYAQKKYDRATAETLLSRGFGLSTEEIKKLLDGLDQAASEETVPASGPLPAQTQALILNYATEYL